MTTIPEAVLAEARKVYCGGRFAGFEEALAVLARHWPAATPSDGYAAGVRDGLEKAASAIQPKNPPEDWTEFARIRAEAANEIRALAPPDDGLIVGRLRWVETRDGWEDLASGRVLWGAIGPCPGGWQAVKGRMFDHLPLAKTTRHDTPEAARAALVAAVRREVEGGDNG